MNICFVSDGLTRTSGIDRAVFELAKRLVKRHDITIASFSHRIDNELINQAKLLGINVISIPYPGPRIIRRYYAIKKGYDLLKKQNFEIVNGHGLILSIVASLKFPLVLTNHWHPLSFLSFQWFCEYSIPIYLSKKIVAISEFVRRETLKIYHKNSDVVYWGIDHKIFNRKAQPKDLGENSILSIGRLHPIKGTDILIRCFNKVKKEVQNAKLFIIGKITDINYWYYIKKLAKRDVTFINEVSENELPSYYSGCTIYASATKWEGFGFPFLEAMACGKTVVGFNKASMKEIIANGDNGFLSNNENEFSDALKMLLTDCDLRKKMERKAYKYVKKFNWNKTTKKYLHIFKNV